MYHIYDDERRFYAAVCSTLQVAKSAAPRAHSFMLMIIQRVKQTVWRPSLRALRSNRMQIIVAISGGAAKIFPPAVGAPQSRRGQAWHARG